MEFFIVSAQIDHYRGGENKWFTIKQNFVWNVILLTPLCIKFNEYLSIYI